VVVLVRALVVGGEVVGGEVVGGEVDGGEVDGVGDPPEPPDPAGAGDGFVVAGVVWGVVVGAPLDGGGVDVPGVAPGWSDGGVRSFPLREVTAGKLPPYCGMAESTPAM
jgi:hypothetical protein